MKKNELGFMLAETLIVADFYFSNSYIFVCSI